MNMTTRNLHVWRWLPVLAAITAAPLNAGSLEDQLAAHLFAPDVIMRHHRDIGLQPEQRDAVTQAVRSAQREILDLQWELEDAGAALIEVLAETDPDNERVFARLDAVLTAENKIKRRHILLLIEIRRVLSADQRAVLRDLATADNP